VAPRAAATEIGKSLSSPLRRAAVAVFSTDVAISRETFEILREVSLLFFINYGSISRISSKSAPVKAEHTFAASWTSFAALMSSETRSFSAAGMTDKRGQVISGASRGGAEEGKARQPADCVRRVVRPDPVDNGSAPSPRAIAVYLGQHASRHPPSITRLAAQNKRLSARTLQTRVGPNVYAHIRSTSLYCPNPFCKLAFECTFPVLRARQRSDTQFAKFCDPRLRSRPGFGAFANQTDDCRLRMSTSTTSCPPAAFPLCQVRAHTFSAPLKLFVLV